MKHVMSRREMMRTSAILVGSVCGCQQAEHGGAPRSSCCSTPKLEPESVAVGDKNITVDLSKAQSLGEVGHAALIVDKEKKLDIILVRAESEKYFALSGRCTHGRMRIGYHRERGVLQCTSFGHSTFALSGQVLKGPAESSLKSYPVRRVRSTLIITL